MQIEFYSFNYAGSEIRQEWIKKISQKIEENSFIGGSEIAKFERSWAEFTKSKNAIGVSNGMDGLVLSLRALGIGPKSRVAIPSHTFIATWTSVIAVGAIPIGVDVDSDGLIDLEQFADVASTVDAVLPVHMHGSPVDMQALSEICIAKSKNDHIKIIEDASQAHGVLMKNGTTPGHYSDAVVYSLYPTKNLGALGDAGIVTTNHEDVADKLRILGSYGSRPQNKYEHVELGFNNRLDSLQAAVLSVNLERLHDWNAVRRKLSEIYIEKLSGNIRILQEFRSDSVRHHLCILSENRGSLKEFLLTKGITTEIHYPKVAGKEALRFLNQQGKFPKAESIANETLSLPLSQWHSTEQVSFVADKILDWISH